MSWADSVQRLTSERRDFVLVSLTAIRGSAPQIVGAKMIVTANGLESGTVGGGKIENHCIEHAKLLLEQQSDSEQRTWNLQTDIGMTCGGEVTMFFDCNRFKKWNIAIFGAGHVAQELMRVMSSWEQCSITLSDPREEWVSKVPEASHIQKSVQESHEERVSNLPDGTFVVSLTRGHSADIPVLEAALREEHRFPFIGVIGSKVKGNKIKKELSEKGISQQALERLICPIGLPFGDNTPPEIAISIAAQLLTVKDSLND